MIVRLAYFLPLISLLILTFETVKAGDNSIEKDARTLTNLLEYISRDYSHAVKDQKVINEFEYDEMKEFAERSNSLFQDLSKTKIGRKITSSDSLTIINQFDSLEGAIQNKSSQSTIADLTSSIKKQVIDLGAFAMAPDEWPDIKQGKSIYQNKCAQCHGKKGEGDGPSASVLEPKPTNFVKDSINDISPFQAFNVIRLGIEGTSMRAFDELSDKEIWQTSFYLNAMNYEEGYGQKGLQDLGTKLKSSFTLKELATLTDQAIIKKLNNPKPSKLKQIAALRLYKPERNSKKKPTRIAIDKLHETLRLYENGKPDQAKKVALKAYLKGIEPIERELKASSPEMVNKLEKDMSQVRSAIQSNKSAEQIKAHINQAKSSVVESQQLIGEENFSFWSASFVSGSILLREGLEAFLIIITILSVLRAAGANYASRWIHAGWITAVLTGIASWFFTDWLVAMSSGSRELMEGIGALLAVFILLYIGFWFHSKTEAKQWKAFVENKIGKALNNKNLIGLAAIAFIVVFREAFESVLFLSTLNLKVSPANEAGIWIGALAAAIIVAIVATLIMRYSKKIPIAKLFKYSAIVISILAVVMAGNGIHEFQEAGFVSITQFPFDLRVGVLGIYPSYEIIGTQLLTVVISVGLWFYSQRSPQASSQHIE